MSCRYRSRSPRSRERLRAQASTSRGQSFPVRCVIHASQDHFTNLELALDIISRCRGNEYVTKRKIVRPTATEDVPKSIGWLLEKKGNEDPLAVGVTLPLRDVRANAYGEFTPNSCRLESLSCSLVSAVIDMTATQIQSPVWKFSRQKP